MCRYAFHIYKLPHACFHCRKAFKQRPLCDLPEHLTPPPGEPWISPCPQCGRPMAYVGRDFKAPKQRDEKQWKKAEILYRHGFAYHSCGCGGPGPRPALLREVDQFLRENLPKSEGGLLLEKIAKNVEARERRSRRRRR